MLKNICPLSEIDSWCDGPAPQVGVEAASATLKKRTILHLLCPHHTCRSLLFSRRKRSAWRQGSQAPVADQFAFLHQLLENYVQDISWHVYPHQLLRSSVFTSHATSPFQRKPNRGSNHSQSVELKERNPPSYPGIYLIYFRLHVE